MIRNIASRPRRDQQRGLSLLLGLIMLTLLTLLAISAFHASNVNLRIAGNMQVRQETLAAAQTAIEQLLSTPAFIDPTTPPASASVNLNGASYTVNFTPAPSCTSIVKILSKELVPQDPDTCDTKPEDCKCIGSDAQGSVTGQVWSDTTVSSCVNTRWVVTANVADPSTGAHSILEQGVAVRMSKSDALTLCP